MSAYDEKLSENCDHQNDSVHTAPETGEYRACDDCGLFLGVVDA